MNKLLTTITCAFCIAFCMMNVNGLRAQEDPTAPTASIDTSSSDYEMPIYDFIVVARSYGDSVVLRWAPQNAGVWLSANYYGWNIIREKNQEEIKENDTVFTKVLNPKPIKAMTLDEMMARYDSSNLYVGAAAQALYGPVHYDVSPEEEGFANYVFRREQEQTQRQAMAYMAAEMSTDAADALGLRYVDRDVKKGATYTYRVECLVPEEMAATPVKLVDVLCTPFVRSYEEQIPEINFFQNTPFTVFVYWEKNRLSGYYLERSSDNGRHWEAINVSPIYGYQPDQETFEVLGEDIANLLVDNVGLIDSLPLNAKFLYRVRAFDAFGDYAPERKSEPFEMEDFIAPTVPVLDAIVPEDNTVCTLDWFMDYQDEDLKGFVVTFSDNPAGPWDKVTDLLPPKTRQWVDKKAHDRGRGYYRVFAVDHNNNYSFSQSQINNIEDDVPPTPPTGVAAIIDTLGALYMEWSPNPEKDILGYRVYFANQLDHDFIQKKGRRIEDTVYTDTLSRNTLTKNVYFYVVAEDNSHNFSQPSDTLAVPVPDIIPPGIAVLQDYTQTNESVTFTWLQSTSEDVAYYYIYRKFDNEKQWKCIRIIKPDELKPEEPIVFTDYPEPSAKNYNYCIEVLDDSKKSSGKTGQTTVRFRGASVVEIPMTLKATLTKNKAAVKLDFTYEYTSKRSYYGVIYKSVDGEPAYAITSFQRGENTYTDYSVKPGQKVSYTFQMFLGTGKRSQKSKPANVTLPSK
ncbi:MAG: hypothetical protein II757_05585 [Bacteroidales bacterium]|nr:hypothetical protein [Bacteroidales bacterium]